MIQLVSLLPNVIHTDSLINTKLFLQHLLLVWVILQQCHDWGHELRVIVI
jgi:hypothetical protein